MSNKLQKMCLLLVIINVVILLTIQKSRAEEIEINNDNFPDPYFRGVLYNYDSNADGVLSSIEAAAIKELSVSESQIRNLRGIEFLSQLEKLTVNGEYNGRLDLSKNAHLKEVTLIGVTRLTSINVIGCEQLTDLTIRGASNLTNLDLRMNKNLINLTCTGSQLASLNVDNNIKLISLNCNNNRITELNLNKLQKLEKLSCAMNGLTALDIRNNLSLKEIEFGFNNISSLLLASDYPKLNSCSCYGTPLLSLDVSHFSSLQRLTACGTRLTEKTLKLNPVMAELKEYQIVNVSSDYLESGDSIIRTRFYRKETSNGIISLLLDDCRLQGETVVVKYYIESKYGKTKEENHIAGTAFSIPKISIPCEDAYFLGWALTPNCKEAQYKSGDKLTVYRDTVLFPVYKYKTYRVSFNLNGGTSGAPNALNIRQAYIGEIPKSSPVREGYYFMGWAKKADAEKPNYKSGDIIESAQGDVILYAIWKKAIITKKISFNANGGSGQAPKTINVQLGKSAVIPKTVITREGYWFLGWAMTKNATVATYKSGDSINVSDNMELFAVWRTKTISCAVIFDTNGGSNPPAMMTTAKGAQIIIPKCNVVRDGYWFMGWSLHKNDTVAMCKSGTSIQITTDTVLYAVWKSQTTTSCTLTFDANGGTNPPAAIMAAQGATVTIPSSSVSREGYWFLGWATSKTATTAQYKSGNTLTLSANTTLYAVWKKK